MEDVEYLNVEYFTKSGDEYYPEDGGIDPGNGIEVPSGLSYSETREWIRENRPFKDELHMVITDEFAMPIIGESMMDLATSDKSMKNEKLWELLETQSRTLRRIKTVVEGRHIHGISDSNTLTMIDNIFMDEARAHINKLNEEE